MIPIKKTVYALQTSLDRAIDQYKTNLQNNIKLKDDDKKKWDAFKELERGKVQIVAQLQQGLEKYRRTVKKMSTDEREDEEHDSSRLGDHMRAVGLPKPGFYYHAHAIISGGDTRSWRLRTVLADCEIGIDDPHNGCWLPASTRYCGQRPYPKAVPHSRIHRENYYTWLQFRFLGVRDTKTLIHRLKSTRDDLLYATYPPGVMLKKGEWREAHDNL